MQIKLNLGHVSIPVTLKDTDQEELYRKTEKELQAAIEKYKAAYPTHSNDFVYLFVAFEIMLKKISLEQQYQKESEKIQQRIQDMTKQLSF